jgi:succinate dehydrogenase / fumarate reductase, cytochrome b subunit
LDGLTHADAYYNLVTGFQNPLIVAVYLIAVAALALHLFHGVWSMFQSLGLNSPNVDRLIRGLALASAVVLFLGFAAVPLGVMAQILRLA